MSKFEFESTNGQKLRVIRITPEIRRESQTYYAHALTEALSSGAPLNAQLERELRERGLWDSDAEQAEIKRLRDVINTSVSSLMSARSSSGDKMTKLEGRKLAIEILDFRRKLGDVGQNRSNLFNSSVESVATNEQLQFFVYACTVDEEGERFWNSFDEFKESDSEDVSKATRLFLSLNMGTDSDNRDPEVKWLIRMNFMNEDGEFIDDQGRTITSDGKLIDDEGNYIDENGDRVDIYGNKVDDNGQIIYEDGWAE